MIAPVGPAQQPTSFSVDVDLAQRPDLLVASAPYVQGSGSGGLYALVSCGTCTTTAIEVALLSAQADGSGIHIRWNVHEPDGSTATLERRTHSEDLSARAQLDQAGRPVASGTYFLRLTAGSSITRRFVVLR
jgi:hypothetical protein